MLLSVFTPSHNPRFLDDCYASLQAQSHADWEWIVLLNGRAREWAPPAPGDERVKVFRAPPQKVKGVGAAKRAACGQASGEVLVELDHDDVLATGCLEAIERAFTEHPDVVCVFSDFAQINEDGSTNDARFNESMGWVYDEVDVDGVTRLRCNALEPSPHNVGYIWYAPNHVRSFRTSAYHEVGGYDATLNVLDDQDLLMRLFAVGDFHRVPECLYLQRMHPKNTQVDPATNAHIQSQTVTMYLQNIEEMAKAWAARHGLEEMTLRTQDMPGAPAQGDRVVIISPETPTLPFADSSVGLIKAHELLQRLPDRAAFFNECHRVLVHGGLILTETPSTDGRGAFQDPSHVAFYNENSFWYLTQESLRPSLPMLKARLQVSQLRTYYPTPWHEQTDIPYVQANLLCVKDGPRQGGPLLA
jgi:hypothetical protein